eukprot:3526130-Rhodomonas_salina.1
MSRPRVDAEALPRRKAPSRGAWRSRESAATPGARGERETEHRDAVREEAKKAKQRRRARGEEEGVAEPNRRARREGAKKAKPH